MASSELGKAQAYEHSLVLEKHAQGDRSAEHLDVCTYSRARFSTKGEMITIVVGEGLLDVTAEASETFHIHVGLLTEHSDFFAAALSKDWKESQQRVVRLPRDRAEQFEVLVNFLYGGRIHIPASYDVNVDVASEGGTIPDGLSREDSVWELLARCWVLGDKLGAAHFQDAIVDAIVQRMMETKRVPKNLHFIAYCELGGDNGLRRLVVDIAAWRYETVDFERVEADAALMPFYRDTIARLQERCAMRSSTTSAGPEIEPWASDTCELYHTHRGGWCYDAPMVVGGYR